MDVRFIVLTLFFILFASCSQKPTFQQTFKAPAKQCTEYVAPNRYLVHKKSGEVLIEVSSFEELEKKYSDEKILASVSTIEPDFQIHIDSSVTKFAKENGHWGVESVNVSPAWSAGAYGQNTVVAVIDSGIDLSHPQLKNQLKINSAEATGSWGFDDDQNGFVDDVFGWNFTDQTPDVSDGIGHGTHVAGIIAAEHAADPLAPQGIAPQARLLPIQFMDNFGNGYISNAIRAIEYAMVQGATVINASWGGSKCSTVLQQKIEFLGSKEIIFVAAAGNSGRNIDSDLVYPASFNLANQITVGAINSLKELASFSNFGPLNVHLLAPGVGILSTYPGGQTALMSGTSMATPFVTAAVAVLKSYRPKASVAQIKNAILKSVSPADYPVASRGHLNIGVALSYLSNP